MSDLPKPFKKFTEDYPKVAQAYEKLGDEIHSAGPLDENTRALIKLSISVRGRMEGVVHSHTRKTLDAGCTKEEIRQTVSLAVTTIGLPNIMASMTWTNDILES